MISIKRIKYGLVIFALAFDGIAISKYGMKFTLSRILSIYFIIIIFARAMSGRKLVVGGDAGRALLAWLLFSLVIDKYYSSTLPTLHHWINLCVGVIWFYVVLNLRPDWKTLQKSLLYTGSVVAALSIAALSARAISYNPYGITDYLVPKVVNLYRLVMFSWEPNIFGTTMAVWLILSLPMLQERPRHYLVNWLMMLIALIVSLSKGPWVAFSIGLTIYVAITKSRMAIKTYFVLATGLVLSIAGILMIHASLFISSVVRFKDVTVRLVQDQRALADIARSPVFGNGTFSFGDRWPYLNYQFGDHQLNAAWVSQAPLGILHDTGVIGIALMGTFWIYLLRRASSSLRSAKSTCETNYYRFACAIFAASCVLLIEDWFTTLYALPIYWAVMGITAMLPYWLKNCKYDGQLHNARITGLA